MKKMLLGLSTLALVHTAAAIEAPHVPGEIIVKFKTGKERSFFANNFASSGVTKDRSIKLSTGSLSVLKVSDKSASMTEMLERLNNDPAIEYAEPNFIYSIDPVFSASSKIKEVMESPFAAMGVEVPNDTMFEKLWGLRNTGSNDPKGTAGVEGSDINALKAWEITKGSRDVVIAVIDTGIDYNHPDLKDNLWVNPGEIAGNGIDDDGNGFVDDVYGYNFALNKGDPKDGNGHGTHCAGTIGAVHNNELGVAGVMGDVKIMAVKFLTDSGSGSLEHAVKSIDYATQMNVDLMSNSWGGGGYSQALFDAIKRASDKGIVFTAAAGNSATNNDTTASYPANYAVPNVISVAAMTAQNTLASFSQYGKRTVHIAAPGHNILSSVPNGKYDVYSGTSMATPHVSGAIGLLIAKEGRMDLETLRDRVMYTGVPVAGLRGKTVTASRLDAYNLLTDTRPERSGPNPSLWTTHTLDQAFESNHPYDNGKTITKRFTVPGAKYIRVRFAKYELESGYDYVRVADTAGNTVEKVTGTGENYVTDYVEGDTVEMNFVSDRSKTMWGYEVREIEWQ